MCIDRQPFGKGEGSSSPILQLAPELSIDGRMRRGINLPAMDDLTDVGSDPTISVGQKMCSTRKLFLRVESRALLTVYQG